MTLRSNYVNMSFITGTDCPNIYKLALSVVRAEKRNMIKNALIRNFKINCDLLEIM